MKITGIIAEYNPFHNGHALQAAEIKRKEGGCVIAVCGGFFTQRGELSALSKIAKAKAAIAGGVDIVLELPLCYTVSPAPDFAMGGVGILNALGAVDNLAFGCEQEPSKGLFELLTPLKMQTTAV